MAPTDRSEINVFTWRLKLVNCTKSEMDLLYLILFVVIMVLLSILIGAFYLKHDPSNIKSTLKTIVLIIAHPDDECMFFSPTILAFKEKNVKVRLLCLSTGDYYGQGKVRTKELGESCKKLGITHEMIKIIDDRDLKDDPCVEWSPEKISQIILQDIKEYPVDGIITFDGYGVSGHTNHIAVCNSIRLLLSNSDLPKNIPCWTLDSVNVFRKYIGALDVIPSLSSSDLCFVSSFKQIFQGQSAMASHWSQFMWFRILYICFSRYMVVNTLSLIRTT